MSAPSVRVADVLAGKHDGSEVTLRGWVWRIRSSGKIVFAVLRDSTGVVQTTVKKGAVPDADFDGAVAASVEASVVVKSNVVKDERAPGGYEVKATAFTLVGPSHGFPHLRIHRRPEAEDVLLDDGLQGERGDPGASWLSIEADARSRRTAPGSDGEPAARTRPRGG